MTFLLQSLPLPIHSDSAYVCSSQDSCGNSVSATDSGHNPCHGISDRSDGHLPTLRNHAPHLFYNFSAGNNKYRRLRYRQMRKSRDTFPYIRYSAEKKADEESRQACLKFQICFVPVGSHRQEMPLPTRRAEGKSPIQ